MLQPDRNVPQRAVKGRARAVTPPRPDKLDPKLSSAASHATHTQLCWQQKGCGIKTADRGYEARPLGLFRGGLPKHIVFCYVQLDVIQKGSFISLEINLGKKESRGNSNSVTQSRCSADVKFIAHVMVWDGQKQKKWREGGVFNHLPNETQLFHHLGDVAKLQFLAKNLLLMNVPNGICCAG